MSQCQEKIREGTTMHTRSTSVSQNTQPCKGNLTVRPCHLSRTRPACRFQSWQRLSQPPHVPSVRRTSSRIWHHILWENFAGKTRDYQDAINSHARSEERSFAFPEQISLCACFTSPTVLRTVLHQQRPTDSPCYTLPLPAPFACSTGLARLLSKRQDSVACTAYATSVMHWRSILHLHFSVLWTGGNSVGWPKMREQQMV